MRPVIIILIITLFILAMDLYSSRGIVELFSLKGEVKSLFLWIFWGISVAMFLAFLWAGSRFRELRNPGGFFGITLVMGIFLMLYVPKLVFNATQLLGDLSAALTRLIDVGTPGTSIRKYFLIPGGILAVFLFLAFGMGMARGRTNVKVFRETVAIAGLPASFDNLRIVHLSDLHLAGFYHHPQYLEEVTDRVNRLEPDLVLFTGDMVHNFSEEMDPFVEILQQIRAPLGKFAILGNHDYGHYYNWDDPAEEAANLDRVKAQIRESGFDLLLNEHRRISVNGQSVELVGVENWGKPPFPQKGDLERAMEGTGPELVKILLSHDPSHWDLKVRGKEEIALTLSGHTHGMQFGFELGRFRWSPSRWTYRHWAGLYRENGQYLYVNRGLGYTGFPGRVGIRPEITLLTLVGG